MIFDVNGKRLVFGMQWEALLSDADVHSKARTGKSRYVWTQDKAFYYGVLNVADREEKLRMPLYSGAIVLQHRYPDEQNLMLVLEVPNGTYIACGLHQGRPRSGFDAVVADRAALDALLSSFKELCGAASFNLYGDARIAGIEHVSMADLVGSIDNTAQLRRVKSAFVNPLAAMGAGAVAIAVVAYSVHTYQQYRAAEAQRLALAAQKSSQTLYAEELAARRNDAALPARSVAEILAPIQGMGLTNGGWPLTKASCNVSIEKLLVCTFEYARRQHSAATNKTFVDAAGKSFDSIEFAGDLIKATKQYKSAALLAQGKVIDAAQGQREETIEFGSALQRLAMFGKPKLEEHQPFALPASAVLGELAAPPIGAANWEFVGPLRSVKGLAAFPAYATVSRIVVTFSDKPAYELRQSLAMVTVSGRIFSKPH
ncbi:type 4b pilus protein PilO2 [Massilia sp. erpn]|uniref:type 4b pilus protein PilO2 n=1 Tax=Massilia sp. erpn TaxID=2738142 RepID=UPI002107E45D|nr:type 4b pilus protein PilO2 [Massilia sp. erpn]UTY55862.1 type 4b pilus protein PilO2 [Massilia sp. erpn]